MAYNQQYYLAHRDETLKKQRQRYWDDPDGARQQSIIRAKRYNDSIRGQNKLLARRYGITLAQYDEIWVEQLGLCAICHSSPSLCIDHDHNTNKVRGLLCTKCNKGLGIFGDDASLVQNAADYLRSCV